MYRQNGDLTNLLKSAWQKSAPQWQHLYWGFPYLLWRQILTLIEVGCRGFHRLQLLGLWRQDLWQRVQTILFVGLRDRSELAEYSTWFKFGSVSDSIWDGFLIKAAINFTSLNGTCGFENWILHFCVAQKNLMLPNSLFLDLILWSLYSAGPRMMEQLQEIGHFFTQALRPPFHGFLFYWPASEHFLCNLSAELKTPRGQRCLALGSYPLLFILSASRYHILLMEVDTFRIH